MTVNAADILALRYKHPHVSKIYMSVLQPEIIYCGTIVGSPERGATELTISPADRDPSYDLSDVEDGMTAYVGTACGDHSKAKRRIKGLIGSVAASTIEVDENFIEWAEGDHVTVYKTWE